MTQEIEKGQSFNRMYDSGKCRTQRHVSPLCVLVNTKHQNRNEVTWFVHLSK